MDLALHCLATLDLCCQIDLEVSCLKVVNEGDQTTDVWFPEHDTTPGV